MSVHTGSWWCSGCEKSYTISWGMLKCLIWHGRQTAGWEDYEIGNLWDSLKGLKCTVDSGKAVSWLDTSGVRIGHLFLAMFADV